MRLALILLLSLSSLKLGAQTWEIGPDFWLTPRRADAVLQNPESRAGMAAYLRAPESKLRLHYQKRDEATAQAEELRGWFIALGVEADRIELLDDNPRPNLKLEITDGR